MTALSAQFAPPSGERAPLPKDAKPAPRLPDGKPDLRGVWTLGFGSSFFSKRSAEMAQEHRYAPTNAAEEAMNPAMREKYKAQLEAGKGRDIDRDLLDPTIKACAPHSPSGEIQRGLPFEIIQLPDRVILRFEEDHWVRQVWMDGRGHPKDLAPTWMGHSIGKWDGDTLVIETVGMDALTWLDSQVTRIPKRCA